MDSIIQNALNRAETEVQGRKSGAKIVVVGAGGAGNNSVTRLNEMGGVKGATITAINTDSQQLDMAKAEKKLLLGYSLTKGLGAGGFPKVGKDAAEASKSELKELLRGANLVFITCGLGGGTGTGSAPVVAEIAREEGAIVIGTVTTPFDLEKARIAKAEDGLMELRQVADTVIAIDNNKLVEFVPDLPINKAFAVADELVASIIKGITETITVPSLVNLDFADVRAVMTGGGVAMIGVGESNGKTKVKDAVESALKHPLLDVDYCGGTGAMIHVTGGPNMTLAEVTEAGSIISESLDSSAQVIWGARIDPALGEKIRVMSIVTGVKSPNIVGRGDLAYGAQPIKLGTRMSPKVLNELRIDYVH